MVKSALEPSWEARFEANSYGFRPGRGCHDAIAKIYLLAGPHRRKPWVVDADIKGAFDNIDHAFLLRQLGDVPGRELVKQWLKAGCMEEGTWHATPAGTPQGGVISPLLLNIALHGLEAALGVKYNARGDNVGKRGLVRYADDLVVFCASQEDAQAARQDLQAWLGERGLSLSEEKTRIVHLTDGFDFLGFNVRHYAVARASRTGHKLLIKPSKRSVTELREKLRGIWQQGRGQALAVVLHRLNPVIRGWANYFRTVVSSQVFRLLDHWMYHRANRYGRSRHPLKSQAWRTQRYWGKLNPQRNDRWVFGDKRTGQFLVKFSWHAIHRHVLVRGQASPDDPKLREYWWRRQRVNAHHLSPSDRKLAASQNWICRVCGLALLNGEPLERHHRVPKEEGGSDAYSNRELLHLYCHQQVTAAQRKCRRRATAGGP
jgi:RNA-directed DNA polymerase